MNAVQIVQRYFDSWNHRNTEEIIASFAERGTYSDPTAGQGLTREATAEYAKGLWDAFPDLSFETVSQVETDPCTVVAEWLMRGTNTGSLAGLPPTGHTVSLPGADFIKIEGDKIRSVQGYFDPVSVPKQLGMQVIVQPTTIGPFSFGTAALVATGKNTKPGAYSVTMLCARSDEEVQRVSDLSQKIVTEMLEMQGFISWVGMTIGHRQMTVTAWETPDNARQMYSSGSHPDAIGKFKGQELAAGGMTSVWSSGRFTVYRRCPRCLKMVNIEQTGGKCPCGESLEPLPF